MKITILTPENPNYAPALECYEGVPNDVTYFMYSDDSDDSEVFFCQRKDGRFYLLLNNMDWLTTDLALILKECQNYTA